MEAKLKDLYYDPKFGYVSINKLLLKVRKSHPNITKKELQTFLDKQYTFQVTKEIRKPKEYNSITAKYPRHNYQIDLLIYDRYEIHNYKYILVVIDVYSRYVEARPLTNRELSTIKKAMEDIFATIGYPQNMNSDNEFNKKEILELFKLHNITPHFSQVGEINKNAIVERFNRTLANILQKYRVASKKRNWYKVLPDIIKNYNTTYHRTIKAIPEDVFEGKDENHQKIVRLPPPIYKVGDVVRIKQVKPVLGKGDYIKYSEETYIINEITKNRLTVEDENGNEKKVKAYELRKVNEIMTFEPDETLDRVDLPESLIQSDVKKNKKVAKELKNLQIDMVTNELPSKRIPKKKVWS